MTPIRQILLLCLTHLRVWWRTPRQALTSLLLSSAYLLVGTQLLNVRVDNHIRIGLHSTGGSVAASMEKELREFGVLPVNYSSYAKGKRDLEQGGIVALVSIRTRRINLVLSGHNPLLDRELDGILLRAAARVSSETPEAPHVVVRTKRHSSKDMTTFMTASLIPFLILSLAMVNCGMHWLRDWESGTLYTFVVTPARRYTLLIARTLTGSLLALFILAVSLALCRQIIPWELPDNMTIWFAVVLLQVFFAIGFFFALAAICREYILYVDVAMLIVILLMFASGAIKPFAAMAQWERIIAWATPTFYAVRSMRAAMLGGAPLLFRDLATLSLWGLACYALGYILFTFSSIKRGAQ